MLDYNCRYVVLFHPFHPSALSISAFSMVLILDGNSLSGVHIRHNLCYSTCLRHLIRSRIVTNWIFYTKRPVFHHACATCYHLILLPWHLQALWFRAGLSRNFFLCCTSFFLYFLFHDKPIQIVTNLIKFE